MGRGDIVLALQPAEAGDTILHAQGREDAALDKVFPGHARDPAGQFPGHHIEDVVIGITRPESPGRLEVSQAMDQLGPAVSGVGPDHQVALAQGQAAAMHQQVAHRHVGRDIGVMHGELGQVFHHRLVPADLARLDQQGQAGRCIGLGVGGDGKQRRLIDRGGTAQTPDAIAFRQQGLAVPDDGQAQARLFESGHGPCDQILDIGEIRLSLGPGRARHHAAKGKSAAQACQGRPAGQKATHHGSPSGCLRQGIVQALPDGDLQIAHIACR